ncbi:MAG: sugar phosphate nucleotidyltransferase [bacterium]|nr:sugar phosphate nucleotidyltransferase [bacterium]
MNSVNEHLYALIFAGGGGTRLWPLSREGKPKQFLKLFSDKSLLQETYERARKLIPPQRIFVITMSRYAKEVGRELPELPQEQIIEEPGRRSTGPAVLLGTLAITLRDPEAIIVNLWADHLVADDKEFSEAILSGAESIANGANLLTTGLMPTFPHTGLGYIKKGSSFDKSGSQEVFRVEKFIEKPNVKSAEDMLDRGGYLWNVGLYIWRADAIIRSFATHAPELAGFEDELVLGLKSKDLTRIEKAYADMPEVSIDNAISEKAKNFLVVEAQFRWSDIGSFEVVWENKPKDLDGNVILGKGGWVGTDTRGSFLSSDNGQLIATIGLSNIVVVATKDVVLVMPKDESQRLKELINHLKKDKKEYL